MAVFEDKIQNLMDEVYSEWQKEENKGKGKWEVLDDFSEAHQIAVVLGNFNYQVGNGGIEQWLYNGYFQDDAEKLTKYLEIGAESNEQCQKILNRIYELEQYANETDCDRYGYYLDDDGDSSFIGDMIDCDAFDTWYYEHCDNEDWWETVSGIIDKAEGRDSAPVHQDGRGSGNEPEKNASPIQVYIENRRDEYMGGFTIPLPTDAETLRPWLEKIAPVGSVQDIAVKDITSTVPRLMDALIIIEPVGSAADTLNELNYLAERLQTLDGTGTEVFEAILETGKHCGSLKEIINLTFEENISQFDIQPAFNEMMYGEFLIQSGRDEHADAFNRIEQSENFADRAFAGYIERLESHVDAEAFGRSAAKEENGIFTEQGYLTGGDGLTELYHGLDDIPPEYRIFDSPEQSREHHLPEELNPLAGLIPADANKDEISYLAAKIRGMDEEQRDIFDAVIESGQYCGSVAEIINLTENLDCFELQYGRNEAEYGEYRLEQDWKLCEEVVSRLEKSANPAERALVKHLTLLERCADNETYGYHSAKEEGDIYTSQGLLIQEDDLEEKYRGVQDIPPEYRSSEPISEPDTEKGYVIAVSDDSDYYIPNAMHIERNDSITPWIFQDDKEAAVGAERDGVKLIYDMDGVNNGVYLDTPENRAVIKDFLTLNAAELSDSLTERKKITSAEIPRSARNSDSEKKSVLERIAKSREQPPAADKPRQNKPTKSHGEEL